MQLHNSQHIQRELKLGGFGSVDPKKEKMGVLQESPHVRVVSGYEDMHGVIEHTGQINLFKENLDLQRTSSEMGGATTQKTADVKSSLDIYS